MMNDFYCDMNCKSCTDGCSRRLVPPDITESDPNIQSMKILGENFVRQMIEDDEKFIFLRVSQFLLEAKKVVIPKELLLKALAFYKEERPYEYEKYLKEKN